MFWSLSTFEGECCRKVAGRSDRLQMLVQGAHVLMYGSEVVWGLLGDRIMIDRLLNKGVRDLCGMKGLVLSRVDRLENVRFFKVVYKG